MSISKGDEEKDEEVFFNHPEFSKNIQINKKCFYWNSYGYAVSKKLYTEGIHRIEVRFKEIPAVAWFGVLRCVDDGYEMEMGNVHDRTCLCVFQSNGFCAQSGLSYGNSPWSFKDVLIGLEINLLKKSGVENKTTSPSVTKPQSIVNKSPYPPIINKTTCEDTIVNKSPSPQIFSNVKTQSSTSKSVPTKTKLNSNPNNSVPTKTKLNLNPNNSVPTKTKLNPNPNNSVPTKTRLNSVSFSPGPPIPPPSQPDALPSYTSSSYTSQSTSSFSSSSSPSSSSSTLSTSNSYSSYKTPNANRTSHTLHFFVNDELQPVSYSNVPTSLRFVMYCNYTNSECEFVSCREITPLNCVESLIVQNKMKVAKISDPEQKGYFPRVVEWNPTDERVDR